MMAAAVLGLAGYAVQALGSESEQGYLQDFPVVLSASRLSQPLSEAPNAMTVIDRRMITDSGARTLADVFMLVPGMYVAYYTGSQPIVSYHGVFGQSAPGMQVLIDGRSVYLPPFNTVDWTLLPITLDDVERIEVIRGPAAASYGENSVHGVINIITRDASAAEGTSLSNTRGNKGINDAALHYGHHGERLDYRLTAAYTADNGFDNLSSPPNGLTLSQASNLINNSSDNNQTRLMNYRATYRPNAIDEVDVQLGFNHNVQQVGFWDSRLDKPHDMISYENMQQVEWARRPDANTEMKLRFNHIQHDTNEDYRLGSGPAATFMKTGRNDVEFQHSLRTSDANRLVYGAGYRQDTVEGFSYYPAVAPGAFPTSFTMYEYRVFGNDEWRLNRKLLFNAGGMLERDEMGNHTFSPRVSANYHIDAQQTVRLGVSIAHRTPALGELNSSQNDQYQLGMLYEPGPAVTSPGLSPEKILSREIGYLGEFHEWNTSVDLRLFNDQMNNVIYPTNNIYLNGMTANYTGAEMSLRHAFGDSSDLTVNYATGMIDSNSLSLPGGLNSLADSLPRNTVSALYSQRHLPNEMSFSAAYYMQTSMLGFDRGAEDYQPTHHRVDVRVAEPFNVPGNWKGEVSAVVQNLFNTGYTEYIATALFNRRAFVTLTLHQ